MYINGISAQAFQKPIPSSSVSAFPVFETQKEVLLKTDLLQVSFGRGHTKRKGYQGISEQANTLFAKSEQDLAFADFMMAHRVDLPYAPYSYVLLNCQQALEKRLKAIIRTPLEDENGEVTPDMCFRLRTHDLRELSDLL